MRRGMARGRVMRCKGLGDAGLCRARGPSLWEGM